MDEAPSLIRLTVCSQSDDSSLRMEEAAEIGNDAKAPRRSGRLPKRILLSATGFIAFFALLVWSAAKWSDWTRFQSDLRTYKGVSIGQTKMEVQYALDTPQTVQGPEIETKEGWKTSSPLKVNMNEKNDAIPAGYDPVPQGRSAMDYDEWHYWSDEGTFDVEFDSKSGLVASISCYQLNDKPVPCDVIFGIGQNASEHEVVRLLGKPDKEEISGGDTIMGFPVQVSKTMDYKALGLHLVLAKREVTSITKRASQGAGFGWWFSHHVL